MNKNAKQITRIYIQYLKAAPSEVFPLLCPVREYEWIYYWKCELIYSESGYAEKGCIFKTNFPGEGPCTWIVSKYEPDKEIGFIISNENRIMQYNITLLTNNDETTIAEWKQVITSLNKAGEKYIDNFTEEKYRSQRQKVEELLNYYLIHKEMKKPE